MPKAHCIVCGEPGKPRGCCSDSPIFCDDHDTEHRRRVHADAPSRSVDEALYQALANEDFEDE